MVKLYISFSHQQHGLLRHVLPKMLWISKISKKKLLLILQVITLNVYNVTILCL